MSQQNSPNTAYILSLIGGIFVLLAGIVLMIAGAVVTFFYFGIGAILGILGLFWGIAIIFSAVMLKNHPDQHTTWGALILVFSLLSWVGGLGGFLIGFILALIGGIMGLTWNPTPSVIPPPPQMPQASTGMRTCMGCGMQLQANVKFCPGCGKQQF